MPDQTPPSVTSTPSDMNAAPSVNSPFPPPNPVEIPPIISNEPASSKPKRKFPVTILGVLFLVIALGAGVVLIGQKQLFNQKAAGSCTCTSPSGYGSVSGTCSSTGVCTCPTGGSIIYNGCSPNVGTCTSGEKTCTNNSIYSCVNQSWQFVENCSSSGKTCSNGSCIDNTPTCISDGNCTTGQSCCSGNSYNDTTCGTVPVRCGTIPPCTPGDRKQDCTTLQNCPGEHVCSNEGVWSSTCYDLADNCPVAPTAPPAGSCTLDSDCAYLNIPANNIRYICQLQTATQTKKCVLQSSCTPVTSERCNPDGYNGNRDKVDICTNDAWVTKAICPEDQVCCKKCDSTNPSSCFTGQQPPNYECRTSCTSVVPTNTPTPKPTAPPTNPPTNPPSNPTPTPTVAPVCNSECSLSSNCPAGLVCATLPCPSGLNCPGGVINRCRNSECTDETDCSCPPPMCTAIKIYDEAGTLLTPITLTKLHGGDIIRLAVSGTPANKIDSAQFTVNGVDLSVTTTKNTAGEYYTDYTLPTGVSTFSVTVKLHHLTIGWF